MKRIHRRQFAKLAGGMVAAVAVSRAAPSLQEPVPKLKLTPQQEERVREAVTRRDRQLAAIRNRTLPYALEPAFVFRVQRSAGKRRI